jgi:hypothetical protein
MTWQEVLENARKNLNNDNCCACPVCNGRACGNKVPGPGAKGSGDGAIRNFDAWRNIRVNLDTICPNADLDTTIELFGRSFAYPIFAGPVGAVRQHYGDCYDDVTYNRALVPGCAEAGIAAFTGDGIDDSVMVAACDAIRESGGVGIPTVKPWDEITVREKFALVRASGAFAVAMDVDAAGLPFLKGRIPPAGRKSQEELAEIIREAGVPFIVKGVMTVAGAEKALAAGAAAIIVSNHGGRVLDGCPGTAEVLPEIVDAVGGKIKILVDGGIRSGLDVFRALAIGADAVVVARPYVTAIYGGGVEGIRVLTEKLGGELKDVMQMVGANTLADINRSMIHI